MDCCGGDRVAGGSLEEAVAARYSAAALAVEPSLCCPVDYDPAWLEVIPPEVIERDYGCGDPSRHVAAGEDVLDLGSGGGKTCFIAAQVVGPRGSVVGIDVNDQMLTLARGAVATVSARIGFENVRFGKGRIQDLSLDLEQLDAWLAGHEVATWQDWQRLEEEVRRLRLEAPLVADASVDVVVSNCVLNLVRREDRELLFEEIRRVLRPGGRAVISDIVSDRDVPPPLQADAALWSGCLSGAFREDRFVAAFERAGFEEVGLLARQEQPWAEVEGISFRSVTIRAVVPGDGPRSAVREMPGQECCSTDPECCPG